MHYRHECRIFYLNAGGKGVGVGHKGGDTMYQLEMTHSGSAYFHEHLIGNAEEFQGVIVDTPLHVLIRHAINFQLAIDSFEGGRVLVVSQMRNRDLDGNELRFVVLPPVELRFQLLPGSVLHEARDGAVANGIEEEDPSQQYGSNVSQARVKFLR
jgi:hypothetical protein